MADPGDPNKSKDDLFRDMHGAAGQRVGAPYALGHAAALMVKVAGENNAAITDLKDHISKLNDRNTTLQSAVTKLTWVAVILAGLQVMLAALPYFAPSASKAASTTATIETPASGPVPAHAR